MTLTVAGSLACTEKPPGAATQELQPSGTGAEVAGAQWRGQASPADDHEPSESSSRPQPLPPEKWRELSAQETRVMVHKGTERPFSGKYVRNEAHGTYHCRRCNAPLFASDAKFDSGTGWPSFDAALPGAVRRVPDPDGHRIEIVCANCGAHLGHVFEGEGFTEKGVRHCVNSVSLSFEPAGQEQAATKQQAYAYFAGGCFWGVEHYMEQLPGVIKAESGYMGGKTANPSYEEVSSHRTGHAETVRVTYDPSRVSYETLARLFFEIHDPTQRDRQGPDVGSQYRSEVFVTSEQQRLVIEKLIGELKGRGYDVATRVTPAGAFYEAEAYHQDYYERKSGTPYCHTRVRRFDD